MIASLISLEVQDLENEGWIFSPPSLVGHSKYEYWLRKTTAIYKDLVDSNPKFEFRPYQPEHAALYSLRRYNICNGDLGLGKTIEAGLTIAAIYGSVKDRRPGSIHILVTSRDAALTRWLVDLRCIEKFKDESLIEFIDSERKVIESEAPIWIYTHDFPKNQSKTYKAKKNAKICDLILKSKRHPSMLVIDEIHNISKKTLRHQQISRLSRKAKRKLGLTGTLSDGRLEKVHQCLRLIYNNRVESSERQFVKKFTNKFAVKTNYLRGEDQDSEIEVQERYLPGLAISQIPAYSELRNRFIHRTRLSDPNIISVCKVPEAVYIPEILDLGAEHEELYTKVVRQNHPAIKALIEYGTSKDRLKAMSISHKLMQASSSPWLFTENIVSKKLKHLCEIIEKNKEQNRKVVIFTNIVAVGGFVERFINSIFGQETCLRVYASDPSALPRSLSKVDRTERLEKLMYSPNFHVGMFNIKLVNNSIDLTTVGTLVFWDVPWESIWVQQAIKRSVRPGSIYDQVYVHFLINRKTIDFHQYNLLTEKVKRSSVIQDFDVSQVNKGDLGSINPLDVLKNLSVEHE